MCDIVDYIGAFDLITMTKLDDRDFGERRLVWESRDFSRVVPDEVDAEIMRYLHHVINVAQKAGVERPVGKIYQHTLRWNWKLRTEVYAL